MCIPGGKEITRAAPNGCLQQLQQQLQHAKQVHLIQPIWLPSGVAHGHAATLALFTNSSQVPCYAQPMVAFVFGPQPILFRTCALISVGCSSWARLSPDEPRPCTCEPDFGHAVEWLQSPEVSDNAGATGPINSAGIVAKRTTYTVITHLSYPDYQARSLVTEGAATQILPCPVHRSLCPSLLKPQQVPVPRCPQPLPHTAFPQSVQANIHQEP